jgi:hypothetical protein
MAEFNVEEFRGALLNGARPNQFQGILGDKVDINLSRLLVTAASLPGQSIGTASVFYRGREVKLAGDKVFAPWTTTIINDSDLAIRQGIEEWMELIESNADKLGSVEFTEFTSDLTVSQLDKNGEVIRTYALIGAWPTDVSEIPLSFDANDQISSFSCTWNYQHFVFE